MVLPSSPRYGATIDWATIHSAEGARTNASLFGFFDRNQNASSHAGADGYGISGDWVPDERAAWTLLNGNPRSLNLELCGFARWTRAQWLSEGWVDGVWNPRQMIRNAARWIREKCDKHAIPRRWLTPAQVGRGERGIIMHATYTYGTGDGDHTDLGVNFPADVFMSDVESVGGVPPVVIVEEDEEETVEEKFVLDVAMETKVQRVFLDPRKECALTLVAAQPGQTIFFVGSYHWGSNKQGMGGDPLNGGTLPPIHIHDDNPISWKPPKGTVYADVLYSTAVAGGVLIKHS